MLPISPTTRDAILSVASALSMTGVCNPLLYAQNCTVTPGVSNFRLSRIYTGFTPNFCGFILTMGVAKIANGVLKREMKSRDIHSPYVTKLIVPFIAGGLAGVAVTPTEMVALRENQTGVGTYVTVLKVIRQEGILALWKGWSPTMVRDSLAVSSLIMAPKIKTRLVCRFGLQDPYATLVSSVTAGFVAIIATQWAQVTRIMMQSEPGYPILPGERVASPPTSMRSAISRIWAHLGWRGLFLSSGWRWLSLAGMFGCEIKTTEWLKPKINRLMD